MTKNSIKGSSKKGYTFNGKPITKTDAIRRAKNDPNYEVYSNKNNTKIIRSKPDGVKANNVNSK